MKCVILLLTLASLPDTRDISSTYQKGGGVGVPWVKVIEGVAGAAGGAIGCVPLIGPVLPNPQPAGGGTTGPAGR